MIRSRSPSAAAAASNPGSSRTLRVPWSGMITCGDGGEHQRVLADRGQRGDAVRGPVERRHADRHRGRAGRLAAACQPPASRVSAASSVVRSNQYQPPSSNGAGRARCRPRARRASRAPPRARGSRRPRPCCGRRRPGRCPRSAQPQPDLGERGPAPPVAGGEGVEVRPERHLALLGQRCGRPRRHSQPAPGDRRALEVHRVLHDGAGHRRHGGEGQPRPLVHVEGADAHRVAGAGQDHPLEQGGVGGAHQGEGSGRVGEHEGQCPAAISRVTTSRSLNVRLRAPRTTGLRASRCGADARVRPARPSRRARPGSRTACRRSRSPTSRCASSPRSSPASAR